MALANRKGLDQNCSIVLKYGMKRDFNAYLASLGPGAPIKTLTELRNYNLANRPRNSIRYEQENLDISDEMDLVADRARWQADRNRDQFLGGTHGIDEAIASNNLDALIFPGSSSAGIAAEAQLPTVIVPLGFIPNRQPACRRASTRRTSRTASASPARRAPSPDSLELAYAFEQATRRRVPPSSTP